MSLDLAFQHFCALGKIDAADQSTAWPMVHRNPEIRGLWINIQSGFLSYLAGNIGTRIDLPFDDVIIID